MVCLVRWVSTKSKRDRVIGNGRNRVKVRRGNGGGDGGGSGGRHGGVASDDGVKIPINFHFHRQNSALKKSVPLSQLLDQFFF